MAYNEKLTPMKGTTMRKLVTLEGNIVPVRKGYMDALKYTGKYAAWALGAYCAYYVLVGVLEEAKRLREEKTYTKHD